VIALDGQFERQRLDESNRVVAMTNDYTQFETYLRPRVDDGMVEMHEANGDLVKRYFDDPGFRDLVFRWLAKSLYDDFRKEA